MERTRSGDILLWKSGRSSSMRWRSDCDHGDQVTFRWRSRRCNGDPIALWVDRHGSLCRVVDRRRPRRSKRSVRDPFTLSAILALNAATYRALADRSGSPSSGMGVLNHPAAAPRFTKWGFPKTRCSEGSCHSNNNISSCYGSHHPEFSS